jgi:hypothetical protein
MGGDYAEDEEDFYEEEMEYGEGEESMGDDNYYDYSKELNQYRHSKDSRGQGLSLGLGRGSQGQGKGMGCSLGQGGSQGGMNKSRVKDDDF